MIAIDIECEEFIVTGAGKIKISESSNFRCGGRIGFDFGVEWGKYEYAGGVLPREEAIKLAEHILNNCGRRWQYIEQQDIDE